MMRYVFFLLMFLTIRSTIADYGEDYYWRDYVPGSVPCDAFEGAPGLYVGQFLVRHDNLNFNLPATIYPDTNTAASELFGRKTTENGIKILCSPDNSTFYWAYVDLNKYEDGQMKDAVIGGLEHFNIYIGKVLYEEEWKIGKVTPFEGKIHRGLHVWDRGGAPLHVYQFFILKYNKGNICYKHDN